MHTLTRHFSLLRVMVPGGDHSRTRSRRGMSDTVAQRMAADREKLRRHEHGGLDDLHVQLDESPAHDAAREGDLDTLRRLVDEGPDQASALDKYGLTPLHWAADRGHADVAKYLIEVGANVNQVEQRLFRRTPLHFAAVAPSTETVRVFLECGADPNYTEYRGWTAGHYAAHAGDVAVLGEWMERGGDPTALTKSNESLLHLAASSGHLECVSFLLSPERCGSATVKSLDNSGRSPLDAARDAGHERVTEVLLEGAAALNALASRAGKPPRDTRAVAPPRLTKDATPVRGSSAAAS